MNEKSMTYPQNFAEFAVLRTNFAFGVTVIKTESYSNFADFSGKHIIRPFLYMYMTILTTIHTCKGASIMQEPRPNNTWNHPFGTAALVFYLTEPLDERTVDDICYHIQKLTINPIDSTSYFLLLFPGGASVLLFCPQRAICCGMGNGDLPPVLARARQKITETVLKLIGEQ
jgi:hypothetical protein